MTLFVDADTLSHNLAADAVTDDDSVSSASADEAALPRLRPEASRSATAPPSRLSFG